MARHSLMFYTFILVLVREAVFHPIVCVKMDSNGENGVVAPDVVLPGERLGISKDSYIFVFLSHEIYELLCHRWFKSW